MAKIPLKLDEVIDGAALRDDLAALADAHQGDGSAAKVRAAALRVLKERLAAGRATAERMLMEDGGGTACASRLSHLMDEIIRALYDFATTHVYPSKNPSAGRTNGDRRGRRLRPRYAGARLRHRPSVRASLQADAVGRADRRIPALYAVGSRPEGRPRHPQRRRMHPAVAHRLSRSGHRSSKPASCGATRRSSTSLSGGSTATW